ncbi:unnamed protein product [Pseudo-nitzschia multistriata]|uniref:Uncharacterized protein n=1 Tax=Pseudo-nitzschia multistriata TaxID=183589 RepID=A0A448Z2C5_9STRA|nr:unnamed protein product [Pseudo-nitzschia multistriata]
MRSKSPFLTRLMTLASATTSSVPAGSVSKMLSRSLRVALKSEPPPVDVSAEVPMSLSTIPLNWLRAEEGSISIAESDPSPVEPGTPINGTLTKSPPLRSISIASPRLCAGSVLISATL